MDLHFDVGDTFFIDGDIENGLYEIVNINYEDDEFPYECYPIEIIEKTKKILANGVLKDEGEELYEFKDEDGEIYEFYKNLSFNYIMDNFFVDERRCCSDYDIMEYMYKQTKKELEILKGKSVDKEEISNDVDSELLGKIEKDEDGYVTDNINDFFNYMFSESEEWTFKELVDLLTPAMKEELIFKGDFIGNVGKVDGKYYYHPDIEMLIEKPSVKELIDKAKHSCEEINIATAKEQNVQPKNNFTPAIKF